MTKVSIIIPFKDKTEAELSIPLSSVNQQIGINFAEVDVHLVNDGGETIDITKFDILANLKLYYHELVENVGPGLARQYGIDHSAGGYVMFIDSDDELHYSGALLDFFNLIKGTGEHEVIIGRFIEQQKGNDGIFYYIQSDIYNWGALHGKWFNRQYLQRENLRFHPKLRAANEDLYFVGLACTLSKDVCPLDSVVYSWLWNPNSLSRGNAGKLYHQTYLYVDYCYFNALVIREKRPELLVETVDSSVVRCFEYYSNYPPLSAEDDQLFVERLRQYLLDFHNVWEGYLSRAATGTQAYYQSMKSEKFQDLMNRVFGKV